MGIKLNLGCGHIKKEGYLNIDVRKEVNPDIVLDIRYLESVEDGTVSEIYASHVLEHFPYVHTAEILRRWIAKLTHGGVLDINVPDMQTICRYIANGEDIKKYRGCLYGNQDHSYNYHCAGFTIDLFIMYAQKFNLVMLEAEQNEMGGFPNLHVRLMKTDGDGYNRVNAGQDAT